MTEVIEKVEERVVAENAFLAPTPYMGRDRNEALAPDPETPEVNPDDPDVIEAQPDDDLDAEEKTFKQRYADLRRLTQKLQDDMKELKTTNKTLEQKAEATPAWIPPKTDEELDAFAAENPEAFALFESIAHKRASAEVEKYKNLEEEMVNLKQKSAEEKAITIIRERHPDWDDIRVDENFHDWVGEQTEQIRSWVYDNATDGALAARVLDLYKLDQGITSGGTKKSAKKDEMKAAAAALVKTTDRGSNKSQEKRTFKRSEIARMKPQEYEALEKEIEAAQRDGRIIVG